MTDYPTISDKLATLRHAIEEGVKADTMQALKLCELVDEIAADVKANGDGAPELLSASKPAAPLTVAQRDSIWVAADAMEKSDQHGHADELRAMLAASPPAPAQAAEPVAFRQRVERLLVDLHNEGRLSEGQCAKVLDIHRIEWRKIVDDAAIAAPQQPAQAGATGDGEADRIINRLMSSDPEFDDCADAADLIRSLIAEVRALSEELLAATSSQPSPSTAPVLDDDERALKQIDALILAYGRACHRSMSATEMNDACEALKAAIRARAASPQSAPVQTRALTEQEILRMASQHLEMGDLLRSMRTDHIYGDVQVVPFARAILGASDKDEQHDAVSKAYGYLWHIANPEPLMPGHVRVDVYRASYRARAVLRDLLTHEQRVEAINAVRALLLASDKEEA